MKKFSSYRQLLTGIIIGVILSLGVTALGATKILRAEYNNAKVIFNNRVLELKDPIVSIVDEATPQNATNYMPVRAVLEAMQYDVSWDEAQKAIIVKSRVKEFDDPILLRDLLEKVKTLGITSEVIFEPEKDKREVIFTNGNKKLTMPLPKDNETTSTLEYNGKKATINLIIKDRSTFINEKELADAFKKLGFTN